MNWDSCTEETQSALQNLAIRHGLDVADTVAALIERERQAALDQRDTELAQSLRWPMQWQYFAPPTQVFLRTVEATYGRDLANDVAGFLTHERGCATAECNTDYQRLQERHDREMQRWRRHEEALRQVLWQYFQVCEISNRRALEEQWMDLGVQLGFPVLYEGRVVLVEAGTENWKLALYATNEDLARHVARAIRSAHGATVDRE